MANFAALAAEHRAITSAITGSITGAGPAPIRARPIPELPAVHEIVPRVRPAGGTTDLRLVTRRIAGEPLCAQVFARLFADQEHSYWLDSAAVIPGISRLSIVGGGGPLSEWVTAHAGSGEVHIRSATGAPHRATGDMFDYLGRQLAARAIKAAEIPFEFALGYVGFLGYELKADSGGERAHQSSLPDAAFLFSDRAVVVDHETRETWLLALTDDNHEPVTQDWLGEAALAVTASIHAPEPAPEPRPGTELPIRYRHSPAQYAALVRECQTQIRHGESYEICLTNEITAAVTADPLATFLELRRISPAPYAALLRSGHVSVLSASPERFLKISASGHIQAKPIKGTRRRGDDPLDDAQLARSLGESEKDRAENLMIVDLLRNDLGVVAVPGSVEVTRLFEVETYAAVHQLVSTVEAQLRPGLDPIDCVRAAFPGGSMTGAPKRRTMQIIDRLEGGPRGVYSGALGYFSLTGAADLSIVIRTLVVHPDRVTLGVGGAVIALSQPADEVDEMLLKAQAPLAALSRSITDRRS
jgi:para-aminobenzoate synthetase